MHLDIIIIIIISSTYPLGGWLTAALLLSIASALAATMYGVASCRFLLLEFESTTGDFEAYFSLSQRSEDETIITYKTAVGLYQWLRPTTVSSSSSSSNWDDGTCAGFQETMRMELTDVYFDAARSFGVFAVLLAMLMTIWIFGLACLEMNRIQLWLFCALALVCAVSSGLTFLLFRSSLCTTEFISRSCSIDEGGLIMIAATILWMVIFGTVAYFAVPQTRGVQLDFKKQDAHDKLQMEKRMKQKQHQSRKRQSPSYSPNETINTHSSFDSHHHQNRASSSSSPPPRVIASSSPRRTPVEPIQIHDAMKTTTTSPPTTLSMTDIPPRRSSKLMVVDDLSNKNEMEVYIGQRLDRIDQLAQV